MTYLIDTNVISEARRGSKEATAWLRSVDALTIHISVITLGEIMRGIALKARTDQKAAAPLAEWLNVLRHDYRDRILPVTDAVAMQWGRVSAQRSRGDSDGLIAATAIVHDLVVVTRNTKDFDDTGATVINPWD